MKSGVIWTSSSAKAIAGFELRILTKSAGLSPAFSTEAESSSRLKYLLECPWLIASPYLLDKSNFKASEVPGLNETMR